MVTYIFSFFTRIVFMNTSKKISVLALLTCTIVLFSPSNHLFARGDGHMKKILKELNLTEEQKSKMKEMMKDFRAEHGKKEDKSREEKREIAQELDAKIKTILTSEQLAKYETLKAEHKEKKRGRK